MSDDATDLHQRIRLHIDPIGGTDLPRPDREPMREPPTPAR